ncbi:MAG: hypothetical protein J5532_03530, partial [Lachnospiraceae bacterium]|nr:hypothetical protein [Lachnospiraceae bacterium]
YNRQMQNVFHAIEDDAAEALLAMLPEDLRGDYHSLFFRAEGEEELWRIVTAAEPSSRAVRPRRYAPMPNPSPVNI